MNLQLLRLLPEGSQRISWTNPGRETQP